MKNDSTATATATVYSYDTADVLDGAPSAELVEASLAAPNGAVLAYREHGVWHYVPDCREEHYRRLGEDVVTVYVMVEDGEPTRDAICRAIRAAIAAGADEAPEPWEHPAAAEARRLTGIAGCAWDFTSWRDALHVAEGGKLGGVEL